MERYSVLGVIPARYASTRFPGKPLALLRGRPVVEWVWRQAKKARTVGDVWIATDDERIAEAARGFGARAAMTSPDCANGSERIAEAIRDVDVDLIVNIQGDEPQTDPAVIDRAVEALRADPEAQVATARAPFLSREEFESPHAVKVVVDRRGRALYFSRSPLPSLARVEEKAEGRRQKAEQRTQREEPKERTNGGGEEECGAEPSRGRLGHIFQSDLLPGLPVAVYKHLGLYVYRKQALLDFCRMAPSELERIEKLEQLRFLENGYAIAVVEAERDSIGVDTPEDLARLEAIFDPERLR